MNFKASISANTNLTLSGVENKKSKFGPFTREACGCSTCGSASILTIRSFDDIQEVLYVARGKAVINEGDEVSWGGRTWRVRGPHVLPVQELEEAHVV